MSDERMARYHREWAQWWETDRRRHTEPKRPGGWPGEGWGWAWVLVLLGIVLPAISILTGLRFGL